MRGAVALALLALGLLAAPAASQPGGHGGGDAQGEPTASPVSAVSIGFATVRPQRVDVVSGDTVKWTNDSARVHTVTADDESFDSGRFSASQTFSRRFGAAGDVPYHCTLHPLIQGVVAVQDLLLDQPRVAAAPKKPFPLSGRASSALRPGTPLSIEGDSGTGFKPVGSTTVGPGGTFGARLAVPATGSYRAVAGAVTSRPVRLQVRDSRISLAVRHTRGHSVLRAKVTPSARGGNVVLQLFLPERFGWWPVQRAKLDARSTARFEVRTKRRLWARAVLALPDGATVLARSRMLRIGPRAAHASKHRSPSR
ncbi:MAG: hypothetical protein WKF48_08675 [Solirubrobacteraceae bacterium]